jgi:indolepyruvate ferredoxin oxidoreductase beta subunit
MINCLLTGVGGQGTVLASKLIAQCAINEGLNAKTAETIGMAQRGGSVVSHVRIGEDIHSPLIPLGAADIIIGFEPGEAVRSLPYLKKGGTVIVCGKAIKPTTDSLSETSYSGEDMLAYLLSEEQNVIVIDGEEICRKCGSAKVLNTALLGAAAKSGTLGFSAEQFKSAMEMKIKEKFLQMNLEAFELGADAVDK